MTKAHMMLAEELKKRLSSDGWGKCCTESLANALSEIYLRGADDMKTAALEEALDMRNGYQYNSDGKSEGRSACEAVYNRIAAIPLLDDEETKP